MKHFIITWTLATLASTVAFASPETTTGDRLQTNFRQAIGSSKAPRVLSMFTPEIRGQIDEAVMQRLLDQIKIKLGRAKSAKQTAVQSVNKNGHHLITSTSAVIYEKGTAEIKVRAVDGKLVGFNFASEQLGVWFDKPASTKQYEQMGEAFVRAMLLGNETRAFKMLHPALQKQIGDDFKAMTEATRKSIDPKNGLKIAVRRTRMAKDTPESSPTLLIDLDLRNGEVTGTCEIKIQFVSMRGHLLGFQFNK